MPPTPSARRDTLVATGFLVALAAVLALAVVGSLEGTIAGFEFRVRYKEVARTTVAVWMISLLLPSFRRVVPYRWDAADAPLAVFFVVAIVSVVFGGGHFGDIRNLWAAIGLGAIGRALFYPAERRHLFLHYFGAMALLMIAHEVLRNPEVFEFSQFSRYRLVTGNPNPLGYFFAMVAPLFLAEALAASRGRALVASGYFAAAVTGALLTFSRSAALGLMVGTILVLWHHPHRRRMLLVAAAGALVFVAVQRPDQWLGTRATGDTDRLRILHTAVTLGVEDPVLGIGYGMGNLEERFPDRFNELYGRRAFFHHSGNQIVDVFVGTGVLGLLCLGWWARVVFVRAWREFRSASPRKQSPTADQFAMLATVALMAMLEPPMTNGWLSIVLFLAIAYARRPA